MPPLQKATKNVKMRLIFNLNFQMKKIALAILRNSVCLLKKWNCARWLLTLGLLLSNFCNGEGECIIHLGLQKEPILFASANYPNEARWRCKKCWQWCWAKEPPFVCLRCSTPMGEW